MAAITTEQAVAAGSSDTSAPPLRLALSGGGFRATLFHLGVIRALQEAGRLQDVTHIAAVSGGSFVAAHAVLNWESYCAGGSSLEDAANSVLELVRQDLRSQIVRRLPFLLLAQLRKVERTATDELEGFLRTFYKGAKLEQLAGPKRPQLAILGTNVGQARLCWFTADGFAVLPSTEDRGPEFVGRDIIDVAEAVSASAAFPALFPPKRLLRDKLRYEDPSKYQFVTDAGVYDNLALSCFLKDPLTGSVGVFADSPGRVIVSDATATIDWDSDQRPGLFQNLLRSIDIIHQRSSDLLRQKAGIVRRSSSKGREGAPRQTLTVPDESYVLIDIEEDGIAADPCIPAGLQKHLSYIRTDLDAFNEYERHFLVQHGYSVAWHALARSNLLDLGGTPQFSSWRERWPSSVAARPVNRETAAHALAAATSHRFTWLHWADPNTRRLIAWAGALVTTVTLALTGAIYLGTRLWPDDWKLKQFVLEEPISNAEWLKRAAASLHYYADNPIERGERPSIIPPAPLIDPEYTGMQIISTQRIWDLTGWTDVTGGGEELAHVRTTYLIRRDPSRENAVFQFKTSGREIWPWVEPRFKSTAYRPSNNNQDKYYGKQWQVDVTLNSQAPYVPFSLAVGGTYVNAFQAGHLDAGFKAYTDGETATLMVLWPRNHSGRTIRVFYTPDDKSDRQYDFEVERRHHDDRGIVLQFAKPRRNHTYGIEWDW